MPARAFAILLCGPSLAGKSTVAAQLVDRLGALTLSSDALNAERGLPFGGEGLPESVWAETLRLQVERFHLAVGAGRPVIVDDTLCYRWLRDRWRAEAAAAGVAATLLLLAPSRERLLARHASVVDRPVLSLGRLVDHLDRFEWPSADEAAVDVTSPAALDAWCADRAAAAPAPD